MAEETTARWTELSPEQRREASSQLDATLQTRQGRDLLLSSQLPAELRAQYLDVFRRESVDETTWFRQFKDDYLASLGGSEGRGRSPTVEARRRELALEVLDSLEANPELRFHGHGRWR